MADAKLPDGLKHGDFAYIPTAKIFPNSFNPNVMSEAEFEMLEKNVNEVGFLDPILVIPDQDDTWTIIDGEHRWESRRITGEKDTPCIVVDPKIFNDKVMKLETVRMNKIRGSFDTAKFNALIKDLMEVHEIPFEDLAGELGFSDESEFERMVAEGRRSVPKESVAEYDKAVKKVNSIDGLYKLIERLWVKYGATLPANFMVLDFGDRRHLWVQLKPESLATFTDMFREVLEAGYTVDSFLELILFGLDVKDFIAQNEDSLIKIEDAENPQTDIDNFLGLD